MFETDSDAVGVTDDDHYSLYSPTAPFTVSDILILNRSNTLTLDPLERATSLATTWLLPLHHTRIPCQQAG